MEKTKVIQDRKIHATTRRCLIFCGGPLIMWKDADGIERSKQMMLFDGEPLLHRTVKQMTARGFSEQDIVIVTAHPKIHRVPGASVAVLDWGERPERKDIIFGLEWTRPYWGHDRTIMLLGDVFFTDEAIDEIVGYDGLYTNFLLDASNRNTGGPYAEIYAISFDGREGLSVFMRYLQRALHDQRYGRAQATSALLPCVYGKLWDCYTAKAAKGSFPELPTAPSTVINDFTDDFDTPVQLAEWRRRWNSYKKRLR